MSQNFYWVLVILLLFIGVAKTHDFLLMKKNLPTENINEQSFDNDHSRTKRSTTCSNFADNIDEILKKNTHEHVFANDTNPSIAMVWSGKSGVVLVVTLNKANSLFPEFSPCNLFRSTDFGRTYQNISHKINNAVIQSKGGVHTSSADSSYVLFITSGSIFNIAPDNTVIYVSKNSAETIDKVKCPFQLDTTSLSLNPLHAERILVLSTAKQLKTLWLSIDFGRQWKRIESYVSSFRWDPIDKDIFYYTVDVTQKMNSEGFYNDMFRCTVDSYHNPIKLAENVYSFGIQGNFIFMSVEFLGRNGSRVLHVSKNKGNTWDAVQIPIIGSEEFYSLLDMTEDMVFIHVDSAGDSGYGSIYSSGENGIIYDRSLDYHLYPNQGTGTHVTDFYKVESLEGVYTSAQLQPDSKTVHSLITFDKGGVWQPLSAPAGSICPTSETVCNLQLHSQFSISKGVQVAELPTSTKQAPGLILAHGNIGDGLTLVTPNVYISSDGGYSWSQPSELVGPHNYIIADSGGLLVAVASSSLTNKLKYSFDEGACWQEYQFTEEQISVTGLSAEPGNKATEISLWGWQHGDTWWRAITVNFKDAMGRECGNSDYVVWTPHETSDVAHDNGCLLGKKIQYKKRLKGTTCINGDKFESTSLDYTTCSCTKADYMCDYGYTRKDGSLDCVPDQRTHQDICITKEEYIETSTYRKIPGDKCRGGEEHATTKTLVKKSCATSSEDDYGVNKSKFGEDGSKPTSHVIIYVIVLAVVCIVALLIIVAFLVRKKYSRGYVHFTRIPNYDPGDSDSLHASGGTSLHVVDDLDEASQSLNPLGPLRSYSNESDDDLIMT